MKTMNKLTFTMSVLGTLLMITPYLVLAQEANTPWTKRAEETKARVEAKQAERKANQEERKTLAQEKKEAMQTAKQEKFCERFGDTADKVAARLEERTRRIDDRLTKNVERVAQRTAERDMKLKEKRAAEDQRRAELYTKLEELADTDTEKAAVLAFRKTMDAAVAKRRAAVDAAIKTFREGVEKAIQSRGSSMEKNTVQYQAAVATAVKEAKAACAAGTDPQAVRTQFRQALAEARENLKTDRKDMEKVGQQVKVLAQERQAAFRAALEVFKAEAAAARATLKTALGMTDTTEETVDLSR